MQLPAAELLEFNNEYHSYFRRALCQPGEFFVTPMSGSRGSSSSRPPLSTLVDAERSRPVDAERLRNATPPVSSTSAPTARPTGRARAPRPSARGFSTSWTAPALCDASSSSSPARSPPTWTRCGCSPALQSLTGRQLPLHSDGSATSSSYDASPTLTVRNLLLFLACRSIAR